MHRFRILNFASAISMRCLSRELPSLNFLLVSSRFNNNPLCFCSDVATTPKKSPNGNEKTSILDSVENIDLSEYGSEISPKFNFAMYADKSPLLQKFIDLGVNLFEIEKHPKKAHYLVTLTLKRIQPYLLFLENIGVPSDKLGKIITNNPFFFKEDLDDLQVRVNYLLSKKFNKEMIAKIITKNSKWLSTPVRDIDERLGYLQQTFKLSGDEIRKMVVQVPRIALISKKNLITNIFALKEEIGLNEYSLKKAVVSEPQLLKLDPYDLVSTYEYLINTMKVPMALVLEQPKVLTCRSFILKERHKFLESVGKAQYCHLLPGYVNLRELVGTTDIEFCEKISKTSVKLFYDFLKTL